MVLIAALLYPFISNNLFKRQLNRQMMANEKQYIPGLVLLGFAYYVDGALEKSRVTLQAALAVEPLNLDAHFFLGLTLNDLPGEDNRNAAIQHWKKCIELTGPNPTTKKGSDIHAKAVNRLGKSNLFHYLNLDINLSSQLF